MFPQLLIGGVVGLLGLAVMFLVVNAFGEKKGFMQRIGLMCAGLFGVVLGAGALVVGEIVISPHAGGAAADVTAGEPSPEEARKQAGGGGGMMGGMGGGGGMMGGMGGGGGGGMMGGRGGNRASGKRDLTTLVRKLELLTGGVSVKLTDDQVASVAKKLVAVGGEESLTEEQAKVAYEGLVEVLTESQRGQLAKVSLPRRRGGRRGGGDSGPPPGAQTGDGGRGEPEPQNENPFTESANGKALVALLTRFGVEPPELEIQEEPGSEPRPVGGASEAIFRNFDKNKDGKLTKEEAPAFVKSRFEEVDSNKDGSVDLEEMKAGRRSATRE